MVVAQVLPNFLILINNLFVMQRTLREIMKMGIYIFSFPFANSRLITTKRKASQQLSKTSNFNHIKA